MTKRVILAFWALASVLPMPPCVSAQGLDLKAPPHRPRDRDLNGPSLTTDHDLYPYRSPVPYAPGFVSPIETNGGRAGIAGWTAPNPPTGSRGAADPDNAGWLGFGFAMEWGGQARRVRN